MGGGLNQSGNSRLWIRQEVEHSLRRLQTDYINQYQLHCPDPQTSVEETLGVLTDLIREGGFSSALNNGRNFHEALTSKKWLSLNSLFYPLPLFCSTPYPSK
ncbi:aldo/keto reductase [Paenibacillus sp. IHBB 3054]|uniref:aldo/keto reductase n=1 Tax=Paenibacillus sp. IHBB 3054 TaxID=3425689 RepID=UPI003F66A8BD